MVGPTNSFGETGPKDIDNPESTKELNEEQVQQKEELTEQNTENESEAENDQVKPSKEAAASSFNYLFYMIYKVKFENIFRFPSRGNQQSTNLGVNFNDLLHGLVKPQL